MNGNWRWSKIKNKNKNKFKIFYYSLQMNHLRIKPIFFRFDGKSFLRTGTCGLTYKSDYIFGIYFFSLKVIDNPFDCFDSISCQPLKQTASSHLSVVFQTKWLNSTFRLISTFICYFFNKITIYYFTIYFTKITMEIDWTKCFWQRNFLYITSFVAIIVEIIGWNNSITWTIKV